jgi:hypothetical protein
MCQCCLLEVMFNAMRTHYPENVAVPSWSHMWLCYQAYAQVSFRFNLQSYKVETSDQELFACLRDGFGEPTLATKIALLRWMALHHIQDTLKMK